MLRKEGNPPNHPENPRFNSFNTGIFEPIRILPINSIALILSFIIWCLPYLVDATPRCEEIGMIRATPTEDPSNPNWHKEIEETERLRDSHPGRQR